MSDSITVGRVATQKDSRPSKHVLLSAAQEEQNSDATKPPQPQLRPTPEERRAVMKALKAG